MAGRSPHGERGLKSAQVPHVDVAHVRRSPHGERGLKYLSPIVVHGAVRSLPARGAWIEISSRAPRCA